MNFKRIISLALATVTAVSVMSFSSCDVINQFIGNNGGDDLGGASNSTLVMEAEYTYLDDVAGAGISNNNSGLSMIYGDGTDAQKEMWSSGYYVGYTHNDKTVITFKFNSTKATSAVTTFMLGCELNDMTLNAENFAIVVNGEEQYIPNWFIKCSEMDTAKFYAFNLNINLVEGENVIELKVLTGDPTRGPLVDCVKVNATDSELSWNPLADNPERRDNEV